MQRVLALLSGVVLGPQTTLLDVPTSACPDAPGGRHTRYSPGHPASSSVENYMLDSGRRRSHLHSDSMPSVFFCARGGGGGGQRGRWWTA